MVDPQAPGRKAGCVCAATPSDMLGGGVRRRLFESLEATTSATDQIFGLVVGATAVAAAQVAVAVAVGTRGAEDVDTVGVAVVRFVGVQMLDCPLPVAASLSSLARRPVLPSLSLLLTEGVRTGRSPRCLSGRTESGKHNGTKYINMSHIDMLTIKSKILYVDSCEFMIVVNIRRSYIHTYKQNKVIIHYQSCFITLH